MLLVVGNAAVSVGAIYHPIATSGHDVDLVYEVGLAAGQSGANSEIGSRQFYEQGVSTQTAAHKPGLTRTVSGMSAGGQNTINFTFEPFDLSNALKFGAGVPAKTLTLDTPAPYDNLAIVLSAGSLNSNIASGPLETASVLYTINYAGGTTQSGTVFVADWSIRATVASNRTEKLISVGRIGGSPPPLWPQTPETDSQADRWNVFFHRIELTNPAANVLSITFGPVGLDDADGQLNADDDVVIFGLSGVPVPNLTLEVNTTTGLVRFKNPTASPISLTGYEIVSAAGSLNLTGWNSFAAQNLDPVDGPDAGTEAGNSPGEAWATAAGSSQFAMQEGFLLGNSTVPPDGWLSLGAAYDTSLDARDLTASVRKADSSLVSVTVEYVEGSLPGDFDGDQDVDGDDLAIWTENFGSMPAGPLSGDADGDSDVDGADFLVWQQNLSQTPSTATAIQTPEPTGLCMSAMIAMPWPSLRRRRFTRQVASPNSAARCISSDTPPASSRPRP
jgi:hypothetical protein